MNMIFAFFLVLSIFNGVFTEKVFGPEMFSFTIYVDNQAESTLDTGSEKNPYRSINDAFKHINRTLNADSFTLLLAPSRTVYQLKDQVHYIAPTKYKSFGINSWMRNEMDQSTITAANFAILNLTNISISITDVNLIKFSNIKIESYNSSFNTISSELIIQNVNFQIDNENFGKYLFNIKGSTKLQLEDLTMELYRVAVFIRSDYAEGQSITAMKNIEISYINNIFHYFSTIGLRASIINSHSAEIENIRVVSKPNTNCLSPFLYVEGLNDIKLTDLSINGFDTYLIGQLFRFSGVRKINLQKLNIMETKLNINTTFCMWSFKEIDYLRIDSLTFSKNNILTNFRKDRENIQKLFCLNEVRTVKLANHLFYENTLDGNVEFFNILNSNVAIPLLVGLETGVDNIEIYNNKKAKNSHSTFRYLQVRAKSEFNLTLSNIKYLNNLLSGRIFYFQISDLRSKYSQITISDSVTYPLKVSNITIMNDQPVYDLNFFYFNLADDENNYISSCLPPYEKYSIQIDNLIIKNNQFFKANILSGMSVMNLFKSQQAQVYVKNAEVSNNTFHQYNLLQVDKVASTLILANNTFRNNTLISSNLVHTNYMEYSNPCASSNPGPFLALQLVYRFSVLTNTTFADSILEGSNLYISNNPFTIIMNVSVISTNLNTGNLFSTSLTIPGLPPKFQGYMLESNVSKHIKEISDNEIHLLLQESFKNLSDWSATYFYIMNNNTIRNLNLTNGMLMSLSGCNYMHSKIKIAENKIENVNLQTNSSTCLFDIKDFKSLLFSENKFNFVLGNLIILRLDEIVSPQLFNFQNNVIDNSIINTLLSYNGKLTGKLNIIGNKIMKTTISHKVFLVKSEIVTDDWNIQNNYVIQSTISNSIKNGYRTLSSFLTITVLNKNNKMTALSFKENHFIKVTYGILLSQSTFSSNNLIGIQNPSLKLTISDCSFENIYCLGTGALIHLNHLNSVEIDRTTFDGIFGDDRSKVFNIFTSKLKIDNTNYFNIHGFAFGGVISLTINANESSHITIQNSNFFRISSTTYTELSSHTAIGIIGTFLEHYGGGFINSKKVYEQSQLNIENCNFIDLQGTSAIYLQQINCCQCILSKGSYVTSDNNNIELTGLLLTERVSGEVIITGTEIKGKIMQASYMLPTLFRVFGRDLKMFLEDIHIDGRKNELRLADIISGELKLTNCGFKNIIVNQGYFIGVKLQTKTNFTDEGSEPVPYKTQLSIFRSVFSNIKNLIQIPSDQYDNALFFKALNHKLGRLAGDFESTALISLNFFDSVFIRGSTFNDTNIPVIFIEPNEKLTCKINGSIIDIMNSKFVNLTYIMGPAITAKSNCKRLEVKIKNSNFKDNFAQVGGALALYNSTIQLYNLNFINNMANNMAGALLLGRNSIKGISLKKLMFVNNSADFSPDIGYEAVNFNIEFIFSNATANFLTIDKTASGFQIKNATLYELWQHYIQLKFIGENQKETIDFSKGYKIYFSTDMSSQKNSQTFEPSLIPRDKLTILISLKDIRLNILPNVPGNIFLCVETEFMHQCHPILITLRECIRGEFKGNITCETCLANSYSLDPSIPCKACPEFAICTNPYNMIPREGYWKSRVTSNIYPCRNLDKERCPNPNQVEKCQTGHEGFLCDSCEFSNSYVESGYLSCTKCTTSTINFILPVVFTLCYILSEALGIYLIYTRNEQPGQSALLENRRIERSFYFKTLITFAQIISIFYLTSPDVYQKLGMVSQLGSFSSLIMFESQCMLKSIGIPYRNFLQYQIYMAILAPLGHFLLVTLLFVLIKKIKKTINLVQITIVSALFVIINNQPGMLIQIIMLLSCNTKLSDQEPSYLASHPHWVCDSSEYLFIKWALIIPSLIFWGLVLPITLVFLLKVNKINSASEKVKIRLGMLYIDYKENNYYWGLIVMGFKFVLSLMVYGLKGKNEVQTFAFLLLLWLYQHCIKIFKPYKNSEMNRFEKISILLIILNIMIIKYFIDPKNSETINQISIIMSVVLNFGFVIFLIAKIFLLTFFGRIKQEVDDKVSYVQQVDLSMREMNREKEN